jgi:transcriptional regulator of aromatic amino acid metabolism
LQDSLFEHLFGLLPDTVLLLDSKGLVEMANPEARRWFASHHMEPAQYVVLLDDKAKSQLFARMPLQSYEMSYILGTRHLYLTILIDYIQLSGEQRTVLILRDNTEHKQKIAELERLTR